MVVRPLTLADLDWVLELEAKTFSSPWSRGTFLLAMSNKDQIFFLAEEREEPLGYLGLWRMYDSVHITNLAVEPERQRQGVAWRLLEEGERWAKGAPLTLEVRLSNHGAQALYCKFGFEDAGIRPGYYEDDGEDALIMWKGYNCDTGN